MLVGCNVSREIGRMRRQPLPWESLRRDLAVPESLCYIYIYIYMYVCIYIYIYITYIYIYIYIYISPAVSGCRPVECTPVQSTFVGGFWL